MCGGIVDSKADLNIDHITIDSRQVRGGSLFVALPGAQVDGHQYVAAVVASGKNAALVAADYKFDHDGLLNSNSAAENFLNLIRVKDPAIALGVLAAAYRQQFNLPLVAITGSNGKTTVKEMLRAICNLHFGEQQVLATWGNLNNHLGVPLTLLQLKEQHQVAIVELGMNHAGEIDYLSKMVQPTIAAINNVLTAHLGNLGSVANIAKAKGEIYNGLDSKGLACVDLSCEFAASWIKGLQLRQVPVMTFGATTSSCYLQAIDNHGGHFVTPSGPLTIQLQVLGKHNYLNALTVIVLALNLGCSLAQIKQGLEAYTGYKGRLEVKPAFNGGLIIDDSYNANPDSVKAALQALAELPKPYWFILADLKELGDQEIKLHQQIGEVCNQAKINKLLTIGPLAAYAAQCFNGDKIHFKSNQECVEYCRAQLPSKVTLLIKGSNSMRLCEITAALMLAQQGS